MAAEAEAAQDSKKDPETNTFWALAEKGLPVLTALLTLATAAIGYLAVQTKGDLSDAEDRTGILEEDNAALREDVERLTASRDDWKRRAEEAESSPSSSVSSPSDQDGEGQSAAGSCSSNSAEQIWIDPVEVAANSDFALTVTGTCFEPGGRLRISISESDGYCISVECTDLADVPVAADGSFATTSALDVHAASVYEVQDPATVYVVVYADEGVLASQPLRLT